MPLVPDSAKRPDLLFRNAVRFLEVTATDDAERDYMVCACVTGDPDAKNLDIDVVRNQAIELVSYAGDDPYAIALRRLATATVAVIDGDPGAGAEFTAAKLAMETNWPLAPGAPTDRVTFEL